MLNLFASIDQDDTNWIVILKDVGVGSATNVEYIPYHICGSKTVLHRVYHDPAHPSHLLLPMIPEA